MPNQCITPGCTRTAWIEGAQMCPHCFIASRVEAASERRAQQEPPVEPMPTEEDTQPCGLPVCGRESLANFVSRDDDRTPRAYKQRARRDW